MSHSYIINVSDVYLKFKFCLALYFYVPTLLPLFLRLHKNLNIKILLHSVTRLIVHIAAVGHSSISSHLPKIKMTKY